MESETESDRIEMAIPSPVPSDKATDITGHEGRKYMKEITSCLVLQGQPTSITEGKMYVDVYAVLEAFKVTCPARQHAIKKLLCAGERQGHRTALGDLESAMAALFRAIDLERGRQSD